MVKLGLLRCCRLQWGPSTAARAGIEQARGLSTATRTDLGSVCLGNCTFGKLQLGKITLGSCRLGKGHWESTENSLNHFKINQFRFEYIFELYGIL